MCSLPMAFVAVVLLAASGFAGPDNHLYKQRHDLTLHQQQHKAKDHFQGDIIQKQQSLSRRPHGGPVVPSHPDPFNLWFTALLSTAFIGLVPIVIIYFLPISMGSKNKINNKNMLRFLLAFAVGGLLGDVFLHLLPHASEHADTIRVDNHHSHGSTGAWVLVGIMAFFVIEKLIRCTGSGHSHDHMNFEPVFEEPLAKVTGIVEESSTLRHRGKTSAEPSQTSEVSPSKLNDSKITSEFAAAAYLNLVADFTHNFTDGLAIGASFLAGSRIGIVTVIAVLFHEIPHEIGDYAILIQAGVSRKRAMALQVWTAIGALLGTIIGLLMEGIASGTAWIVAFL